MDDVMNTDTTSLSFSTFLGLSQTQKRGLYDASSSTNVSTVAVRHMNRPLVYFINTDMMLWSFQMFLGLPQLIQSKIDDFMKCT